MDTINVFMSQHGDFELVIEFEGKTQVFTMSLSDAEGLAEDILRESRLYRHEEDEYGL